MAIHAALGEQDTLTGVFTGLDGFKSSVADELTALIEVFPTKLLLREKTETMLQERHQGIWRLELQINSTLMLSVRVSITAGCRLDPNFISKIHTVGGALHLWPGQMANWIELILDPESIGLKSTTSTFSCGR